MFGERYIAAAWRNRSLLILTATGNLLPLRLQYTTMKTPREITEAALRAGENKIAFQTSGGLLPGRFMAAAVAAGAYIALGAILSVTVGYGIPEAAAGNPGLQKLLSGLTFPVGLVLVVVLGAELFTGNNALLIPGLTLKRFGAGKVLANWALVWAGNFCGALAVAWLMTYMAGLTSAEPYHSAIIGIAQAKCSLGWGTVLIRGIGANWCVCLAVWLAISGDTLTGKVIGCFLPVATFVILGYEHCVANMFFIPCGMMEGADVSVWQFMWRNLIPATIGNIIGGAVFVGSLHTYLHLTKQD